MPTFLDRFVGERAASLDAKAQGMLQDVDGVSALSILSRLNGRGDEVRNPSAFVATAVKAARQRGGPGPPELERAAAQLKEDGILDDKSLEALQMCPPEAGCHAISTLLAQDESSVRNTSAYLTRNVMNAAKGGGKNGGKSKMGAAPMPMQGMGGMGPQMGYPPRAYSAGPPAAWANPATSALLDTLLEKWTSMLDPKAVAALRNVSTDQAVKVLKELDMKGDEIRNPAAYVQRAINNASRAGQDAYPPAGPYGYEGYDAYSSGLPYAYPPCKGGAKGPGGCSSYDGYDSYGGCYGPAKGKGKGSKSMSFKGVDSFGGVDPWSMLDHSARDALYNAGPQVSNAILGELASKGSNVRNASAYVVRAVRQAEMGEGAGGAVAQQLAHREPAWDYLDERAQKALSELSEEEQATIRQNLKGKGGSVKNPSAYVVQAVRNARGGKGPGSLVPAEIDDLGGGGSMDGAGQEPSDWRLQLDDTAREALDRLEPEIAQTIMEEMDAKAGSVRNPSAFIFRAVKNAKRGAFGKGSSADGASQGEMGYFEQSELDPELSPLVEELDPKAKSALEEIGSATASRILRTLQNQKNSGMTVGNSSAYVMKAVNNAKRGSIPDLGGLSKRPRML
mmetsp:Transcript_31085/g.56550  ORF Transcript_31085/g.56550 Transcript_31085/m.56550 type:complete len:621 (-) Transcript_31085:66-1928(-)